MAFTFGSGAPAAAPAPSPFGAAPASAPAFGASTGLFGSTAPAFGASTGTSIFGTSAAPAFGAASSAPAFGATSAPAFGATTAAPAASPFGAPAAASAPSLFGSAPAPAPASPFGGSIFGQQSPAPTQANALVPAGMGLFGGMQQQQQQQAMTQQRPGLNYKTKFEELPPQMQQELQKIQQEISSYRDECKALDNISRLHDSAGIKQSMASETASLRQTLHALYNAAVGDDEALMAFREKVMVLLRNTETAIRLYQRSRLWREISQAPGAGPAAALASQAVAEQMAQPVVLPNPYLAVAVRGFTEALEQYHKCISELERVMSGASGHGAGAGADDTSAVLSLPTLVARMHDYFVHVASRLDKLHGEVARAREAYLSQRRAAGDYHDPFAEARPIHHLPSGPGKQGGGGGGGASGYSSGFAAGASAFGFGTSSAIGGGGGSTSGYVAGAVLGYGTSGFGGGGGGASSMQGAPGGLLALPSSGAAAAAAQTPGGLFGLTPGAFGSAAPPAWGGAGAFGTPVGSGVATRGATTAGRSGSNKKR